MESVEIDADEKDGQVVEPASEMQDSDMVIAAPRRKSAALRCAIPGLRVAQSCPTAGRHVSTRVTEVEPRKRSVSSKSNGALDAAFFVEEKIEVVSPQHQVHGSTKTNAELW